MRHLWTIAAVSAALLAGCYTDVTTSSSKYLTPDQSAATVTLPVDATAVEIVKLFASRGATLVDQTPLQPAGTLMIKLAASRGRIGRGVESHAIDSVFYVRVEPTSGGAKLMIVGKAAVDGLEPCSTDPGFQLACTTVNVNTDLADVTGYEEAQVIHGVLAELQLDVRQNLPNPAATAAANARAAQADQVELDAAARKRAACEAQRSAISANASSMTDLDARGALLQSMPNCDAPGAL